MKEYTKEEITAMVDPDIVHIVNKWLARGDGIAVYENHDLSSVNAGHKQFMSYGSPTAQCEETTPPAKMPDIGGRIGWRYQLIGTYRGEVL